MTELSKLAIHMTLSASPILQVLDELLRICFCNTRYFLHESQVFGQYLEIVARVAPAEFEVRPLFSGFSVKNH